MALDSRSTLGRFAAALGAVGCALLAPPGSHAEESPSTRPQSAGSTRPTIALVLSGGGARGASHIGILEVFEELRIPVDYITGNSMGAIVGGYYAVGYSPEELAETITSIDWVDIFRDLPSRRDLPFRRKQDTREYRVQARLGFKDWSFQFPKGLVQGQKLDLVLKRLALPVWRIRDFDELQLPFRCVATDIETGEAVILGGGDLATAIRASMSVPGAFSPVEIDGRLLVDGMVSNNIPIDAAKAFAPDVVIAVDIGTQPLKREQIQSAFSISGQVLSLLMQEGSREQLALLESQDLLIEPDLSGISTSDFPRVAEAIERGRAAAHAMADQLAIFSVSEEEWQRYLARQRMPPSVPPVIEGIQIDDDSALSTAVLESKLHIETGEPLDLAQLELNLQQIFAMDLFESVDFTLIPKGEGALLDVRTRQKSWGTNTVRMNLEIHENFEDTHHYNLGFQVTGMPLNRLGAEWRNEFRFGSSLRVFSEYYQPFTPSTQWFVSPNFTYETPERNIFVGGTRVAEYRIRNTSVQLDLGRQLGNWGEARVGFGYLDQRASPIVGAPDLPILSGGSGAYFARFSVDTVDDVNFPTRGIQAGVQFAGVDEALGSDSNYQQIQYSGSVSHTWRDNTLTAASSVITDFGDAPPSISGELGGFLRLSGLSQGEVAGRKLLFGALVAYRELAAPSLLGFEMPFYLGGSLEFGGAWDDWDAFSYDSMTWAGSVFFGASTIIGPFYLAYGHAEGSNAVYLMLGPRF